MSSFDEIASEMPDPFRLLWREKVSSTNDELRVLAENGMREGLVLVAEEQTAGRGRRGAAWISQAGDSLVFSVLLRPKEVREFWSRISLVAGLAVAEALEKHVPLAEIKWPNDVLLGGRKIAGILVETGRDFVILGIGINVNTPGFPRDLEATSLKLETGSTVAREDVLLGVINSLSRHLARMGRDFDEILGAIAERCHLTGHTVTMACADGRREGIVKGIGPGGELLLARNGGIERILQADEVRVIDRREFPDQEPE